MSEMVIWSHYKFPYKKILCLQSNVIYEEVLGHSFTFTGPMSACNGYLWSGFSTLGNTSVIKASTKKCWPGPRTNSLCWPGVNCGWSCKVTLTPVVSVKLYIYSYCSTLRSKWSPWRKPNQIKEQSSGHKIFSHWGIC